MLNTQVDLGLFQMPSTPPVNNNDPRQQEFERFFYSEQPWEGDIQLRNVYFRKFNLIRDSDQVHRRTRTYNRYLNGEETTLSEAMDHAIEQFIVVKTTLLKSIYLSQPSFKTEKPRNTNSITHRTIQNCWTKQNSFKTRTISTIFSSFSLLKISQLISETNDLTPNGYLKGLLIYKYVSFQQHTLQEILQNFQTTSRITDTLLVWKRI